MHPPPPTGTTGNAPPPVVESPGCGESVVVVAAPSDGTTVPLSPDPGARRNATTIAARPKLTRWPRLTCGRISLLPPVVDPVTFDSEPNTN
jgi:hypothetical protein